MALNPTRWILAAALAAACVSITPARADEPLSLAGMWRFRRDDKDVGLTEQWAARRLPAAAADRSQGPSEIHLPGTTDEARAGRPNTNKATLDGLYRSNIYTGPAWYQRDVDVPADWQGRRLTLFWSVCAGSRKCGWTAGRWASRRTASFRRTSTTWARRWRPARTGSPSAWTTRLRSTWACSCRPSTAARPPT